MPYKNPKELLTAATALPAAIEAKLPVGVPKVSTMLLDATAKMPDLPNFPMELPDLPAIPELPGPPGGAMLRRNYVTEVEVRPVPAGPSPMPRSKVAQAVGGGRLIEGRGF